MGMTHYMELMMGSWYLLVLFMALPMFLAECYVVSEILLLLSPQTSVGLKTFNRWSAYASAFVIGSRRRRSCAHCRQEGPPGRRRRRSLPYPRARRDGFRDV